MTFLRTSMPARLLFYPSLAIAVACLFLAESRLHAQLQWESTTLREELAMGQANSEAVFRFENKGRDPVIIRSIKSSCSCTTAAVTRTTYHPGDKGEIVARFEVGSRTGAQRNTILVQTNDPLAPSTTLTYAVTIPTLVSISPRLVHWRVGEVPKKATVRVQIHPEAALKITGVTVNGENIQAVLVAGDKPGEHLVEITPSQTNSTSRAVIFLQTEPEVENRHQFSFYALVR